MDFGFGSLLSSFKRHFGTKAAKIFVGLIAVTGALFCLNVIWTITAPLFGWGSQLFANSSPYWLIGKFVSVSSVVFATIGGAGLVMNLFDTRRLLQDTSQMYAEAADIMDECTNITEASISELTRLKLLVYHVSPEWTDIQEGFDEAIRDNSLIIDKARKRAARMRNLSSSFGTLEPTDVTES